MSRTVTMTCDVHGGVIPTTEEHNVKSLELVLDGVTRLVGWGEVCSECRARLKMAVESEATVLATRPVEKHQ
jgi:hypothetical protein